ncbi:MAG: DinB family protein [Terriglobales bacterium]
MKSVFRSTAVAAALAACALLAGAQSSSPVADAVRASVHHAGQTMLAAAKEMPANKYSYKPTAGSMTFGRLVLHIGQSNAFTCHAIAGGTSMAKTTLTPTSPKDELVAYLQKAFNYCDTALANLTDSDLSAEKPFFGGRKVSQAALLFALTDDLADHYSQQAAYLRKNGMLPPSAHGRGTP